MIKWVILPIIIIFFVVRGCSNQISEGIPTGSEEYNRIASEKTKQRNSKQEGCAMNFGTSSTNFLHLRYKYWSPNRVIFENGAVADIGKRCQYGVCVSIRENIVEFLEGKDTPPFYIFRNDLMESETIQTTQNKGVTNESKS